VALALYTKALAAVYRIDALPVLFIYDGRNYRGAAYYDLVGECIDYIPMLLDAGLDAGAAQELVHGRLAIASAHNVNFLNLLTDPGLKSEWHAIRTLIDPGPGYSNLDHCMFNYLGNRPDARSHLDDYDATIHEGPNPLPLHTLLNCITASYRDGMIFHLRTSYACEVEALRAAFARESEVL